MARPIKKEPLLRPNTNLPKVGEFYVNTVELYYRIGPDNDLVRNLSVVFAPVEKIVEHGRDSKIYFDQGKIKVAEAAFKTNMMQNTHECVKILRNLADSIERQSK